MEYKVSLLHSKEPDTSPYPEPDQSCPCPHPTSWRSILILSSHLRLNLQSVMFPYQNLVSTSSLPPYLLHALPISFFLIWSHPNYSWCSSMDHSAHYVVELFPSSDLSVYMPTNWIFLLQHSTGWHKKTRTFEKPNKNWRNPRKKNYWQKMNHYNLPFKRQ